jgi:hypothetical protein
MSIEDVGVVFDSMPAELAGYRRVGSGDGEHLVEYDGEGPNLFLQSGEHRRMEGGELSPAEFLQLVADSGEIDIIDSVLEGDDVWLHGSTTVGGEDEPEDWTEYLMVWGEAEGEFLLWFNAMSQADLDAIIEAFVAAANG